MADGDLDDVAGALGKRLAGRRNLLAPALLAVLALLVVWLVISKTGGDPGGEPSAGVDSAVTRPSGFSPAGRRPSASSPRSGSQPGTITSPPGGAQGGFTSAEASVLRDLDAGKTAVLLFWSPRGSDDQAARRAVQSLDRRGGRIVVRVIPISEVAKYRAITSELVTQTPTTIIVSPDRRAAAIAGLIDPDELDESVRGTLR